MGQCLICQWNWTDCHLAFDVAYMNTFTAWGVRVNEPHSHCHIHPRQRGYLDLVVSARSTFMAPQEKHWYGIEIGWNHLGRLKCPWNMWNYSTSTRCRLWLKTPQAYYTLICSTWINIWVIISYLWHRSMFGQPTL